MKDKDYIRKILLAKRSKDLDGSGFVHDVAMEVREYYLRLLSMLSSNDENGYGLTPYGHNLLIKRISNACNRINRWRQQNWKWTKE